MPNANKPEADFPAPPVPLLRPVAPRVDFASLKQLLDDWMMGDLTEQRETFEVLRRALDENRPTGYKLFP
jgi:hypothetical protein